MKVELIPNLLKALKKAGHELKQQQIERGHKAKKRSTNADKSFLLSPERIGSSTSTLLVKKNITEPDEAATSRKRITSIRCDTSADTVAADVAVAACKSGCPA